MNEISMITVFFAILLGAVITLILMLTYQKNYYLNKEESKNISVQHARTRPTPKKHYKSPAPSGSGKQSGLSKQSDLKKQSDSDKQPAPKKKSQSDDTYLPYHKTYLLTKREYNFYNKLKPIADKYDLQILAKIRLADLVSVDDDIDNKYFEAYFSKIKSKHIDFAIADNMKIVTLLELDDSTHKQTDRIERDEFVDSVVKKCGYNIIHTYSGLKSIEKSMEKYRKSTIK